MTEPVTVRSEPPEPPKGSSSPTRFLKLVLPFIPIIAGSALKLSLLDQVPNVAPERTAFLTASYAKPLWIQLLVSAYMLPVAAFVSGTHLKQGALGALFIIPFVVLLACLFLVFGLGKLGVAGDLWSIWLVDGLAAVSVLVLAFILMKSGK